MLLHRVLVYEKLVPPVCISIVHVSILTVSVLDHCPRTVRMLGLVVYTEKELLHVIVIVLDVLRVGIISLPEHVMDECRPVTCCLIVSRSCRLFPSDTAAVTNSSLALVVRSLLCSDEDHTECTTGAINGCSRSILDD